jgi:hypothetical protein
MVAFSKYVRQRRQGTWPVGEVVGGGGERERASKNNRNKKAAAACLGSELYRGTAIMHRLQLPGAHKNRCESRPPDLPVHIPYRDDRAPDAVYPPPHPYGPSLSLLVMGQFFRRLPSHHGGNSHLARTLCASPLASETEIVTNELRLRVVRHSEGGLLHECR